MTEQLIGGHVEHRDASGFDPESSPLLLTAGEATLFLAAIDASGVTGRRSHVVTLNAPALITVTAPPTGWRWVLGPGLGSALAEATLEGDDELLRDAATRTIESFGAFLRSVAAPPGGRVVHVGRRRSLVRDGQAAVVDETSWVQPAQGVMLLANLVVPADGVPIPPRIALRGQGDLRLVAQPIERVALPALLGGIEWLSSVAVEHALGRHDERQRRAAQLALQSDEQAQAAEEQAVRLLAEQLISRPEAVIEPGADPLVASTTRVLAATKLELTVPRGGLDGREGTAAVRALAVASRVYARRVTLSGSWWAAANDPVLGFHADGAPVALLPAADGMVCVESDGRSATVDKRLATDLLDAGFVFSKPIDDPEVDERTLGRVALAGRHRPIRAYVGWSVLIALAGLAVPFASGVVFNQIVPNSDRARLWFLLAALILVALATLPLQLAATSARTRFETTASLDVQRGIWGRVLASPVTLVKRLGAGDLAMRLSGLETARDSIDLSVLTVLPALLSGLLAGVVLFIYSASLAVAVLIAGVLILGVGLLLARRAARAQDELESATGAVNGFMFQVLVAIPKLRVAGAEARAFLAWAARFRFAVGQRLIRAGARQILLTEMIPTIGSLALFASVTIIGTTTIAVAAFVAFQTTYNLFLSGVTGAVTATGTALSLRPNLDRAIELTAERPEFDPTRADQSRLGGAVTFAGVTFRYQPTARPVLDELSFNIEAGEMVAIAGHSGCGKSTVIRLMLGFEHPEQGSILYDGQHLSSLDVEGVRRQLGVVLQDGQLVPGTIRENLVGVATLSDHEVWELAELVALADEVRAMPMGLDTVVTMNGGAFSGGQRQRLLIGRALAGRPRILLLDEATSSLDNVAQRIITDNLARLGMTRIVVAHRLSTMVDADRILVIDAGRVVEEGSYEELMALEGQFHRLASRQVL